MPATPTATTKAWVEHIMGMPISVHIRAHDVTRVDIAQSVANTFGHLRKIDQVFSTYRSDSDLMRWRRGQLDLDNAHPWLAEIVELSRHAESATNGIFTTDLVAPDGSRGFDPTGLVKGWGVAGAAAYLDQVPEVQYSINAGGDVLCGLGRATPPGPSWRIGLVDPRDATTIADVVEVVQGAVATSGSAARGAHIVDPRNGAPVTRPGSATVVGPDLAWADVWATVCYVAAGDASVADPGGDYRVIYL